MKREAYGVSPVKDTKPFEIPEVPLNAFNVLGFERGARGVLHVLYLSKPPMLNTVSLEENRQMATGYCSCHWVSSQGFNVGLLFKVKQHLAEVAPFKLQILSHEPGKFSPNFDFFPLGILTCVSPDGSLLMVTNPKSSLLVPVDI